MFGELTFNELIRQVTQGNINTPSACVLIVAISAFAWIVVTFIKKW